jgi:hypothetical protein
MNQGEIIQLVRKHEREIKIHEEQFALLLKKYDEIIEIVKSPIRREIYAGKHKQS